MCKSELRMGIIGETRDRQGGVKGREGEDELKKIKKYNKR